MENHVRRTLFLVDLAEAFRHLTAATDAPSRRALRRTFSELQKRCEALQADTRLIADEMDELAHGAVGQLLWEGAGTGKVNLSVAADTTGYHQVLTALEALEKQLKQAIDHLQSQTRGG